MFMLVSRRYERASLIVTSNKPFSAWGEIFGDDATAAAMIDRLVHHAEILSLKGDSYRLKDRVSSRFGGESAPHLQLRRWPAPPALIVIERSRSPGQAARTSQPCRTPRRLRLATPAA